MTSSRTSRRRSSRKNNGVTYGKPTKALYLEARKDVLERQKYLEEHPHKSRFGPETNTKYHYLYGKKYNLQKFYDKHPGGRDILEMTAGMVDSTPTFESYHAFANMPSIMKQLEKYEVTEEEDDGLPCPQSIYAFEEDGFYKTLKRRVRAKFGGKENQKDSLTKATKANSAWAVKVLAQFSLWLLFFSLAFLRRSLPTPVAMICAALAGMFMIQWGFTAMHDASHFAVAPKNHWLNAAITKVWCSISLWNAKVWMYHHAVVHHSYTGSTLDADVFHAAPYVRKSADYPAKAKGDLIQKIGDRFGNVGWAVSLIIFYAFVPGMWLGQAQLYLFYRLGLNKFSRLWGMRKLKTVGGYKTQWWEEVLYVLTIAVMLSRLNLFVLYAYVVSLNIFCSMCIVADHDLLESAITNHVDVDIYGTEPEGEPGTESEAKTKTDWGEVQVRNSTDFVNDKHHVYASLHGGINYQVEHHLFPGMSHIHLASIAPIVQETCKEFGIPYTTYPSLFDAWYSFLLVVKAVMTKKDNIKID